MFMFDSSTLYTNGLGREGRIEVRDIDRAKGSQIIKRWFACRKWKEVREEQMSVIGKKFVMVPIEERKRSVDPAMRRMASEKMAAAFDLRSC